MTLDVEVRGLFAGRSRTRWPGRPPSAIGKTRLSGGVEISATGIVGDEQADTAVHGGPDKALHHYPADHYPWWRAELGTVAIRFGPGHFGENLSTVDATEDDLCIGDILELGGARVQVSQGRQPCWKLNAHTGVGDMARRMQESLRTGWYYRVLVPGVVSPGERLKLIERRHPYWTVREVTAARFASRIDSAVARELAELPELAESWRRAFERKAGPDHVEDARSRLDG
ncbi:MAG: MOSC domain-containing protein [Verrucomicrobiae bacterium]|nr:MOSC domain-containing protein [Verrucomicrobiae bacterium]